MENPASNKGYLPAALLHFYRAVGASAWEFRKAVMLVEVETRCCFFQNHPDLIEPLRQLNTYLLTVSAYCHHDFGYGFGFDGVARDIKGGSSILPALPGLPDSPRLALAQLIDFKAFNLKDKLAFACKKVPLATLGEVEHIRTMLAVWRQFTECVATKYSGKEWFEYERHNFTLVDELINWLGCVRLHIDAGLPMKRETVQWQEISPPVPLVFQAVEQEFGRKRPMYL